MREWRRIYLSVTVLSFVFVSCVKTKFRSNTPDSTPKPGIPAGKSPDETDPNKNVGNAPAVPAPNPVPNPYNPQPVVTSTPLPPTGQLPPKVVDLPGL